MSLSLPAVTLVPGVASNQLIQSPVQIAAIKLSNSSPFDLQISGFGTPGTHWIPAGSEYLITVQNQSSGNLQILPFNNNNITGNGTCLITLYYADEDLPKGSWPMSIPTQTVQAKVSTVTSLINDGNSVGTQIIEATPSPGSNSVSVTNDGLAFFAKQVEVGSLKDDGGATISGNAVISGTFNVTGASTLGTTSVSSMNNSGNEVISGTLAVTSSSSLDNGNIATDGAGNITTKNNGRYESKDTGGTQRAIIYIDTGNNTVVRMAGNQSITLQDNSSAVQYTFDTASFTIASGNRITFEDGSHLKDYHIFSGGGSGTFNHSCPTTPDDIQVCQHAAGSQTMGTNNWTSTQVTVTAGAANAWSGRAVVHG